MLRKLPGKGQLPNSLQPMRSQLTVHLGQYSSSGVKPENQDFYGSLVPDGMALATKGIAVAIADGISTSAAGAMAAETAVKGFLSDYFATSEAWSAQTSGECVISATNSWMHARNMAGRRTPMADEERERGMICTFSALVLKSRTAHIFHVGDSRIARWRGGRIEPLTEEHRVDLGAGKSYLGRALGMNRGVEIDYLRTGIEPGDMFLLTTDGIHEHLLDSAMAELLDADGELDDTARLIADAALSAGSQDNLSIQLVRVVALPDADLGDVLAGEAVLPATTLPEPGQTFEGYAILRTLHTGSRSHVYLANDPTDGSVLALKIPSTDHAADPIQLQALMLEEWIARRVNNPHLLKAPPVRRPRRHAYTVTEYVEGQPLDAWMRGHLRADLDAVRAIFHQIAKGLQALHRREILHRDLRPANILIDSDGRVKIIDFGSAQVAGLEDICPPLLDDPHAGTMQYSAPELYLGRPASRQSDIFSLGVIVYQMLTGGLPYGPRVAVATSRGAQKKLKYVSAIMLNPDVSDWVDATIAKAVHVDPAQRYDELSEFVYDLSQPNRALLSTDDRPFLQRRPERLWQTMCAGLALILMFLLWERSRI